MHFLRLSYTPIEALFEVEEEGSACLELINSFRTPTFISIERLEQVRIFTRPR